MQDKLITQGINSKGFGTIPKVLMQDRRLHVTAKAIYAYFCSYAGGGETAFPSRSKICEDLNIAIDTLGKYLKQLVDYQYIKIEQQKVHGKFSHNVYTLLSEITVSGNSVHGNSVYGNSDRNINNININTFNNNNLIEKNKKEINKEISEVSETNVHTNDTSPYGNEELTPNPLIRNDLWKLIYDFSISRKAFTNQVLELLEDYVLARLEQNPNLTTTQLKASIRSLDQVVHECNNPQVFNKYVEQAIVNATTGPYNQFKKPFNPNNKNNSVVQEKSVKAPFGDCSKCIPIDGDLELAADENGNPLKF